MPFQTYEFFNINQSGYEDTFGKIFPKNAICYLAQSFTIGTTGTNENFALQEIQLNILKTGTPTNDLNVQIWSADANGTPETLLSTGTIAMADIGTVINTYASCTNFSPLTLLASGKYAIVIFHTDATTANYVRWHGDEGGAGHFYGVDGASDVVGAAWIKTTTETTWTRVTTGQDINDFNFIILGQQWNAITATYEEVVTKAGDNRSVTGSSAINAALFVRQAENTLNARTRFNWSSAFPTLDEDVKYIVSNAVASMAAIDIINYDMSGFTSRLEAEDMKKTLRENVEILVKELKDRKRQYFIENE